MKTRKIVITGGPGTGKTSVIQALEESGYYCFHEVSREIIREAKEKGIDQMFLEEPLLFSEMLLEGRIKQHREAENTGGNLVFLDRGVPDVVAYMNYSGNDYPPVFNRVCKEFLYDEVFILPPWKQIYTEDDERYESYEQAVAIHDHLAQSYHYHGYRPMEVPCGSIEDRTSFILDHLV
ncbi:AAA family ATPase [Salinimicrobium flavum]|uniref:AAA family ATPase n=1 Tax=Salinimicrobium flavum TaxID=1737065 RepID=A0ABW5J0K0_9FLAO